MLGFVPQPNLRTVIEANQQILEPNDFPDANSAALLAEEFLDSEKKETSITKSIENFTSPYSSLSNTSIRHNSVKEDSVLEVSKIDNIPQISVGEVSIPKNRMTENSISQVNRSEVSAVETALVHFNSSKVGIDKRSIVKTAFTPTSSTKIGIIKDSFIHEGRGKKEEGRRTHV